MTDSSAHIEAGGATVTARIPHDLARRIGRFVIALLVVAAVAAAWLAFFSFVPFDLRVH